MTLELVPRPGHVLNVRTGEMVDMETASDEALADVKDGLTGLYYGQRDAVARVNAELTRRSDEKLRTGETTTYSFDAGRWHVSVAGGTTGNYDANGLRAELLRMVQAGTSPVTEEAIEGAFKVHEYRLDLGIWKRWCDRYPALREVGERFFKLGSRRVSVTPRPGVIEATAVEEVSA